MYSGLPFSTATINQYLEYHAQGGVVQGAGDNLSQPSALQFLEPASSELFFEISTLDENEDQEYDPFQQRFGSTDTSFIEPKREYSAESIPTSVKRVPTSIHPLVHPHSNLIQRDGNQWKCLLCPKRFKKRVRALGCVAKHNNIREFMCRGRCGSIECDASFYTLDMVMAHVNRVHKRKCGKCFSWISSKNLARHFRCCKL